MYISPSNLSTLIKCGEKYRLQIVEKTQEPGKKGFAMLAGDIVGATLSYLCNSLNVNKAVTEGDISYGLSVILRHRFTSAGIPEILIAPIETLLTDGLDEAIMTQIDSLSMLINASPVYEFKAPPMLKSGKPSKNKTKKPLSVLILEMHDTLTWFCDPDENPYYREIMDAEIMESERKERYTFGGHVIPGRLDQFFVYRDQPYIFEFKYHSTPYTQELVDKSIQFNTYALFHERAKVIVVDAKHRKFFTVRSTPESPALIVSQYESGVKMIENNLFLPVCACDPYTAKKMLCGYKQGVCRFGEASAGNSDDDPGEIDFTEI